MSVNKYNNSKIYLIKCRLDNNLIYVGSTIQTLKQRWNEHKTRYKIESDKEYNKLLYIKMREIGIENFYIELYEIFNYDCKPQLRHKEGEIIKNIGSLNMCIAGRKKEDYDKEYNEKHKEQRQQYRLHNKEKLKEQKKQYRLQNKDKIIERNKIYIDNNKIFIKEYQKQYYLKKKLEKEQII
jgi:hypothetical protein